MSKAKPKTKRTSRASKPRKSAIKSKSENRPRRGGQAHFAPKTAQKQPVPARAKPTSGAKAGWKPNPTKLQKNEQGVVLLSGGNPQIAKGNGDAPVQAYIAAMPEWKRDVGKRLDEIIVRTVPKLRKAVKWNSPFYGVEGQGWFLAFHVFTRYVKVTFFAGQSLRPIPPGPSKDKNARYYDIYEGELDEAQFASWVKQAAALPGWDPSKKS